MNLTISFAIILDSVKLVQMATFKVGDDFYFIYLFLFYTEV